MSLSYVQFLKSTTIKEGRNTGLILRKKAKGLFQAVKKLKKVFQRLVFNALTKNCFKFCFVFFPPGLTPKGAGHSQVGVSELKV